MIDKDQELEELTAAIYDVISKGEIYWHKKTAYNLDDFLFNFDEDTQYFSEMLLGDARSLQSHAKDKLNGFCERLAMRIIKGDL